MRLRRPRNMSIMNSGFIYLASSSSRRRALLEQLGVNYRLMSVTVDERVQPGEDAARHVQRLAVAKVEAAIRALDTRTFPPVLAADTSVAVDGVILGKPVDREAGLAMLAQLSGRSHQVLSAVALRLPAGLRQALSVSRVTFRAIAPAEARAYWDTGEPAGKAGGYAIQGRGALFIERLEGSYSGVMGLPLYETAQLLAQAGLQILSGDSAGQGAGK